MNEILQPPWTSVPLEAMEENRTALWSLFSRMPEAWVHDGPDMLMVLTNEPFAVFNSVHRAQLPAQQVDAAIDSTLARARARGVRLTWFVGPSTRPSDLGVVLQTHGLVRDGDIVGMAMDLSQLPEEIRAPAGLQMTEANDEGELLTWCKTMAAAFDMREAVVDTYHQWVLSLTPEQRSRVHFYVGRLGGTAVATHLLILAAGLAGVHYLGTLPEARGKGIGGAMCLNTFREARARGYRVGVTEAEPSALSPCRKLGLREVYTASTYIWKGGRRVETRIVFSLARGLIRRRTLKQAADDGKGSPAERRAA